ncbi:MAG: glycosyltransferase family 4 protein [Planctomycetota bacterium]
MRILFVAYLFQPEPNAICGLPFAKELVKLGHEVEVLATYPNYPGGRVYDGYRMRLLQRETMDGIPVLRVPLYPSHDKSGLRRIISYTSFALSTATIGVLAVRPADVAYICQGPATLGLPGAVLRLIRGIPFVYNIQDLWPDSLLSTGMFNSPLGLRLVGSWCRWVYRRAARVVVITPGMKRLLGERGVPPEKIEVIYNWCDDSQLECPRADPALADRLGLAGRFNVVFAGNMGAAQSLHAVLAAAEIVKTRYPRVQFVLIGGGVETEPLKQRAAAAGLSNVRFLARRPMSEVAPILRMADVLLVHLKDDPLFRITIPSKTQAYMATGRPILMGVRGDAADLVTRAAAGLACEPENPHSIAEAVGRLQAMSPAELDAMGANGRRFYDEELSIKIGARRYEQVFAAVSPGS